MKTITVTLKEVRKTVWRIFFVLAMLILLWKSPELLALFWSK